MKRILIASSNSGKLRDFAAAAPHGMEVTPIPGLDSLPAAAEDAPTFEGNARKKAEHYSQFTPGETVLADDSGLEVDTLNGAPGVRSARYAAETSALANSSDAANNARLLRELRNVSEERRSARFVCVIAAARDGVTVATFRGEVEGTIARAPKGSSGFGYDPLFYVPELGRTFGECTPEDKARISHRGRAFRKCLEWLLKQ